MAARRRYGIRAFDTAPYYGPSEIVLGNALKALDNEFPRSSYQIVRAPFGSTADASHVLTPTHPQFSKCGRFGNTRDAFDYTPGGVRASVERSLARLHTTYLDTVYLHDVECIADSKAPRTSGDHRTALGVEADAYGLGEGREAVVCGDGDREVLAAIGELRRLKDAGVIRRVGISGTSCLSRLFPRLFRRGSGSKKQQLIVFMFIFIFTQGTPCLRCCGLRSWSGTRPRTRRWTSSCRIVISTFRTARCWSLRGRLSDALASSTSLLRPRSVWRFSPPTHPLGTRHRRISRRSSGELFRCPGALTAKVVYPSLLWNMPFKRRKRWKYRPSWGLARSRTCMKTRGYGAAWTNKALGTTRSGSSAFRM